MSKSYIDINRVYKEFEVRDHVYLGVKPRKGSFNIGGLCQVGNQIF